MAARRPLLLRFYPIPRPAIRAGMNFGFLPPDPWVIQDRVSVPKLVRREEVLYVLVREDIQQVPE